MRNALLAAASLLPDAVEDWGWFDHSYGDPNDQRLMDAEASRLCVPPMSTARHARTGPRDFLLEVQQRFPGNLTIRLNAFVTRHRDRPGHPNRTGVFYREGPRLYHASAQPHGEAGDRKICRCRCEVILAGGAFNTPQLLMLSGIGDPRAFGTNTTSSR